MKHFDVITLFPEMFDALRHGIVGRAWEQSLTSIHFWNPRDFSDDPHRRVDDKAYGGGPGMVMKYEPTAAAIDAAKKNRDATQQQSRVIYLSPQGRPLTQKALFDFAEDPSHLIFLSGRYEGIDERLIEDRVDEEWSIGDYVISGGEFAVMVLIDGIVRLLPGALHDAQSAQQDSFCDNLLDYPQYTRPEIVAGRSVPPVLLNGNHQAIAEWRLQQSLGRTWLKRPDLLEKRRFTTEERALLDAFIYQHTQEHHVSKGENP